MYTQKCFYLIEARWRHSRSLKIYIHAYTLYIHGHIHKNNAIIPNQHIAIASKV